MILVTGAGGKTGQAVVRALAQRGAPVRAWLRRPPAAADARAVCTGDQADPAAWAAALDGVTTVYHICPNMHPDEPAIGRIALTAARRVGVTRFVYHSVLHPQVEAMPHHWHKLRVEEMLFTAGVPFTILQPTAYMQNLRAQWGRILADGDLALPYPPTARLALVDVHDVAAAAAVVLTEPGHDGATYELVGTLPLSQAEVAQVLGGVIGRIVTARAVPLADWEAGAAGLPDYARATLLAMFRYYADHGLVGNPNVLRWLLGRPPATLADVARRWMAG